MAPSGLNAPTITDTSVTLVWTDNSTDESGFKVYQNDNLIHTTPANVTEHSVLGLLPGNAYIFGVSAWNNYGESSKTTLTVMTLSDDTTADAIFFSEYIEGSGYNKALEIVNGSSKSVSLDKYCILSNANNGKWYSSNYSFPTETILNPGEVWVIAHTNADSDIINVADEVTSATVVTFNGDDVRALIMINQTDTTFIDMIGAYRDSTYSASGWSVAGISGATADYTLIRKPGIRQGNPDWAS
ncbi:MAG: lamin tail domain-containing protein, partial [Candidatus Neomarinimicrobiota bacterium]